MTFLKLIVALALVLTATACSTRRESDPPRTATEELLISRAADRAADQLDLHFPPNSKVFVDATNIDGTDSKYAVATLRERMLKLGGNLVADRNNADVVVELRSGALSVDENNVLVGIPQFNLPIPLAGNLNLPEVALFKKAERKGVAKFAGVGYDAKTGQLIDISEPKFGYSHERNYVFLLLFSWERRDFMPDDERLVPLGGSDLPAITGIGEDASE